MLTAGILNGSFYMFTLSELLPARFPLEVVTFAWERRVRRETWILYHSVQSSFFNLCVYLFLKSVGLLVGKL